MAHNVHCQRYIVSLPVLKKYSKRRCLVSGFLGQILGPKWRNYNSSSVMARHRAYSQWRRFLLNGGGTGVWGLA